MRKLWRVSGMPQIWQIMPMSLDPLHRLTSSGMNGPQRHGSDAMYCLSESSTISLSVNDGRTMRVNMRTVQVIYSVPR